MKISDEIIKLNEGDIYSLMLFVLFQMSKDPTYSGLSELAFLLDKDSLLNLCEYFGGLTITIPTIKDLENVLSALKHYKEVKVDKLVLEPTIKDKEVRQIYTQICKTMEEYSFGNSELE